MIYCAGNLLGLVLGNFRKAFGLILTRYLKNLEISGQTPTYLNTVLF